MHSAVHMASQKHMMKVAANAVNVKIRAVIIHAPKTQNVPSISHNMIRHLHRFAARVSLTFMLSLIKLLQQNFN